VSIRLEARTRCGCNPPRPHTPDEQVRGSEGRKRAPPLSPSSRGAAEGGGGRKVANGMKGGESACERPRVKRGKTKGVVENCESRGSIVTLFAGLAKPGRFRRHHHCHYNHHHHHYHHRHHHHLHHRGYTTTGVIHRRHRRRFPRGCLVLLPSSGLSIESTDVVNYSLIRATASIP